MILRGGSAVGCDAQIFGDGVELIKGVFKVIDDLEGEFFQGLDLIGAFLTFVAEPEDIEAEFVAFEQFVVAIGLETFTFLALVTVFGMVGGNEVFEVFCPEWVGAHSEVFVGAQVVDP